MELHHDGSLRRQQVWHIYSTCAIVDGATPFDAIRASAGLSHLKYAIINSVTRVRGSLNRHFIDSACDARLNTLHYY